MKTFLLCFLLITSATAFTQAPAIVWQKTYGGTFSDSVYAIAATADGYIMAGTCYSNNGDVSGNHGGLDFWVVKLNTLGGIQWQKSLGGTGNDEAASVQQTSDGGYIVAGYSKSINGDVTGHHGTADYADCWVVKLTAEGAIQWQKSLGGTRADGASTVQATPDGGYIVAGCSYSNDGDVTGHHAKSSVNDYYADYWVVKLTAAGAIQWQKSLGGTAYDRATAVKATNDGGYIVVGFTLSNDGDVTANPGNNVYWIVKLNGTGDIQWQKCMGSRNGTQSAWAVQVTPDGGYIIAGGASLTADFNSPTDSGDVTGNHGETDMWVVKLNSDGSLDWQKSLGGSMDEEARAIQPTPDGGYLVAGYSFSNDGDVTGNYGGGDWWVVKLNSTGNLLWQKSLGGSSSEYAYSIAFAPGGGYTIAGVARSNDDDVSGNHGYFDAWVVQLAADAAITSQPVITSFSSATAEAGTAITIKGKYFTGATAVSFGGIAAASFSVVSDDTITAVVGLGGTGMVLVTTPGGTASLAGFTYTYCTPGAPTVSISATATTIADGSTVSFTAVPVKGGNSPVYTWKVNGAVVQTSSSAVYSTSSLKNNDAVQVMLTSNYACATTPTALSNSITITVTSGGQSCITGNNFALNQSTDFSANCLLGTKFSVAGGGPLKSLSFYGLSSNASVQMALYKDEGGVPGGLVTVSNQGVVTKGAVNLAVPAGVNIAPGNYWIMAIFNKTDTNVALTETSDKTVFYQSMYFGEAVPATGANFVTYPGQDFSYWMVFDCGAATLPAITSFSPVSAAKGTTVSIKGTGFNGATGVSFGGAAATSFKILTDSTITAVVSTGASGSVSVATPAGTATKAGFTFLNCTPVKAAIGITADAGPAICGGITVTFTAKAANGGTPIYQWYRSGIAAGTNSNKYKDAKLADGDSVYCVMTSTAGCLVANTVKSNALVFTVAPRLIPALTVTSDGGTTLCKGTLITLTATATNAGANPAYQWKKNGVVVGTNSTTYKDSTLKSNDQIVCVLTATQACVLPASATSKPMVFKVNPILAPVVTITPNITGMVCAGTHLIFSSEVANGGKVTYKWYKNGVAAGGNSSATYAQNQLKDGDSVWCIITSVGTCLASPTTKSNVYYYRVFSKNPPVLIITNNAGTGVCPGGSVTFIATATDTITNPQYVWKRNNVAVGDNTATYIDDTPQNGDFVSCTMTEQLPCAAGTAVSYAAIMLNFTTVALPAQPSAISGPGSVGINQTGVTFTVTKTSGLTYNWVVPADVTTVAGQGTRSLTVNWGSTAGTVSVTTANRCGSSPASIKKVAITPSLRLDADNTDVSSSVAGGLLRVYPNPVTSTATIEFTAATASKYEAQVMNQLGQVVTSKAGMTVKGLNRVQFNMAGMASATYYVRLVDTEHGARILKLVKAK